MLNTPMLDRGETWLARQHRLWLYGLCLITILLAVYTFSAARQAPKSPEMLFIPTIQNEVANAQRGNLQFSSSAQLLQFINTQLPADATLVLVGAEAIKGVKRPVVQLSLAVLADPKHLLTTLNKLPYPYVLLGSQTLSGWKATNTFLRSIYADAFPRRYLQFVFRTAPVIVLRYMDYSSRELFDDSGNSALSFGAERLLSQYNSSLQVNAINQPVRCVQMGEKTGDALAYSPDIALPAGQHSVDVFLSQRDSSPHSDVALLDIFADGKRQASLLVHSTDFFQTDQFQRFTLEFMLDRDSKQLAVRVFYLGAVPLCLQGVRFIQ